MPNMPPDGNLSELGEKVLLTLWKLKGVGRSGIKEESLKADLTTTTPQQDLGAEIAHLQNQGFVESAATNGDTLLSLTALGLAILMQLEEDKLQELK